MIVVIVVGAAYFADVNALAWVLSRVNERK